MDGALPLTLMTVVVPESELEEPALCPLVVRDVELAEVWSPN